MNPIFRFFSSLTLTVWLLALSIVLVFFGTLDQVQWGISHTQKLYFESWVVMSPVVSLIKVFTSQQFDPDLAHIKFPLPGGFTLGALLLINLTCAHFRYFKASWKKSGIAILHLGVLLLIISGFTTAMLQQESQMTLNEGGAPVNFSVDYNDQEIVLIDKSAADTDTVTAVPFTLAMDEDSVTLPNGFQLNILAAVENGGMGMRSNLLTEYETFANGVGKRGAPQMSEAQFRQVSNSAASLRDPNVVMLDMHGLPLLNAEGLALKGFAPMMDGVVIEHPPTFKQDEANMAAAAVQVVAPNGETLGTWLLSAGLGPEFPAQGFEYEGKRYDLALRFERTYFPFTLQLKDFKHDKYPGTEIPRNFSSDVIIDNPETGENRPTLIYMNNPLRYGGYTFFQASFANEDTTSILQVVSNATWWLPYLAITLVGLGMCVQFGLGLMSFANRKSSAKKKQPKGMVPPLAGGVIVPGIFLVIGLLISFWGLFSLPKSDFDVQGFAELPVQSGGRILPIDSVARNSLRIIRGRQNVRLEDGTKLSAAEWLLNLSYKPQEADDYPVFRIVNAEVLGLFGWQQDDRKYFSWNELQPQFNQLAELARQVPEQETQRTPFHKALLKLTNALTLYNSLGHALNPGEDYAVWPEIAGPGGEALQNREQGKPFSEEALTPFIMMADYYMRLANTADLGITPPPESRGNNDWLNIGEGMFMTIQSGSLNPVVAGYGAAGDAYRTGDPVVFANAVAGIEHELSQDVNAGRVKFEEWFNLIQPFYYTIVIYVLIFALVCVSWLKWAAPLQKSAYWLLILALVVHTFGLFARMYIQGRPPVTNLYSSAIFVGWVSIILGVIQERIYRNGVGSFVASLIGFATLIIAHNLALTGDTLEMMRAVLDDNFWLATHVVIITAGYGAVFLAGALGIIYIKRGLLTPSLDKSTAKTLYGMSYGITCFGLLFSFVGTMLGGVWADQSWGRFWGWDPKENGALIIVLWGALMLHARWGGLVRERGFMVLAVGGNIVTAWSWFGTNLLGIGLHSYGFLSAAFTWLTIFWLSQVLMIALGMLPLKLWGSKQLCEDSPPPLPQS
ncbi:cytochrome c biogenesis protein [Cerasicoccus maritimus]|uniref:cytochrome c biogenesis protein n=1 Tax=Cerasicoccus maritimus TaxID=490089 RepID=UPI002852D90D|nr:cytochrome c biogenesis protein CcsA [Cerasicoccus maritimus]